MNNKIINVGQKDLPLFCPTKKENLFSSHPRAWYLAPIVAQHTN
jgi:uncharacterized Zn-finger protein